MGRRFSETINIDDSHRIPDMMSAADVQPLKLEKSEFFVRRSSLPQAVKLDVEITPPPTDRQPETRQMGLTVPVPAPPRRYSETVVMNLGTRHRSALEFEFERPSQPLKTDPAVSSTCVSRLAFESRQPKPSPPRAAEPRPNLATRTVSLQRTPDLEDGSPPYFVIALEPVKVMDGEKARFCALVAGSPKPEISWLHDGKPVKENPDFHLTYNKQTGSVGLEILEVFPQDGGHYECVANNVYGTASVSSRLTVEGTMFPRVFQTLFGIKCCPWVCFHRPNPTRQITGPIQPNPLPGDPVDYDPTQSTKHKHFGPIPNPTQTTGKSVWNSLFNFIPVAPS